MENIKELEKKVGESCRIEYVELRGDNIVWVYKVNVYGTFFYCTKDCFYDSKCIGDLLTIAKNYKKNESF